MLVCIAGDCHGQIQQLYRLVEKLEEKAGVGPVDLVVQVGDFGVWPNPDKIDKATLAHEGAGDFPQWYQERRSAPRKTVFIAGNHEDFGFLRNRQSPAKREILPRLHFLPWGEVETFHINGETLRIGGIGGCFAESVFQSKQLLGNSRKNYLLAELKQLVQQRFPKIDLLVLHDAPAGSNREVVARGRRYQKLSSAKGLNELIALVQPRFAVTGHLHVRSERRIEGVRTIGMGIIPKHEMVSPGSLLLLDFPPSGADPADLAEHGFQQPAIRLEPKIENEPAPIQLLADEFIEALAMRALQWADQITGKGRLSKRQDQHVKDLLENHPYARLLLKAIRHRERPRLRRVKDSACWNEIAHRISKQQLSVQQIVKDLDRWDQLAPSPGFIRWQLKLQPNSPILADVGDLQLAHAVEANGVECCLSWAAWPGMDRHDDEFLTWTLTDVPFPFFNNAFYPHIPEHEVDAVILKVQEGARRKNLPMFWWTGPTTKPKDLGERLIQKGFTHGFEAPAMAVDLNAMNENVNPPSGFRIQEVTSDQMLEDWLSVMAPVYEFPAFAARTWREILAHLGLGEDRPLRHFIGYLEDQPVATASLYLGGGVGGISSVATRPDVRRRGIGAAITVEPLREARRLGYGYGILFSSPMGLGIYKRIGFREYGKGNCYVWSNE